MERQKDGSYTFKLRGKEYKLIFEGISPKVYLNGVKQMAKPILRDYIKVEKLPIETSRTNNLGEIIEKTTNEYGVSLQKHLGLKVENNILQNVENNTFDMKKVESKLLKKLKSDYQRRLKNNLNEFKDFDSFKIWYLAQDKKCSYCNISEEDVRYIVMNGILKSKRFPENGVLKQGKARGYYLEVDRKDAALKYSSENCVLACYFCNNDKSDVFDFKSYTLFFQNRKNFLLDLIKRFNNEKGF